MTVYIVKSPFWGDIEYEDVRDARIELNWRHDQLCREGTHLLRSLNRDRFRGTYILGREQKEVEGAVTGSSASRGSIPLA